MLWSSGIPTGPTSTGEGVLLLDPTDYSTETLFLGSIAFARRVEFDFARREAVVLDTTNDEVYQIGSDGSVIVVPIDPNLSISLITTAEPDFYYGTNGGNGSPIWLISTSPGGPVLPVFEPDGVTPATISSNTTGRINSFYYHRPSNSLYYDRRIDIGEESVVKLTLSSSGDQVLASEESPIDVTPPTIGVEVKNISIGRNNNEIFYSLDVNNNGQWPRAFVLNTDTLVPTAYFESGFFRAAGTNTGVYSPDLDRALLYTQDGFREYEFGDVDLVGDAADLVAVDYGVSDMALVTLPCRADTNGDGLASPADFSAWVLSFNSAGVNCEQNGDCLCGPSDFSAWILNFNTGCQ
ncbi:MAG: hypothetical protein AAFR96_10470 [Planctomycetota bacterium]